MRAGVILPGGSAGDQLELAVVAEDAGWDGVFVWEAPYGVDAWTLLGAMAARTEHVRLGTMLTPLPWRRPWKLASQVATLDQLSDGRAILTVGLGALADDLPRTGEVVGVRERAELLDDGIDLVRALWDGELEYHGTNYELAFAQRDQIDVGVPVQERIPIWVVAAWPRPKSMRRALRCDGIVPQFAGEDDYGSPDEIRDIRRWLAEHGAPPDLDLIAQGETPTSDRGAARDQVAAWERAGCTWWLETRWELPHHAARRMEQVRARLEAGPPVG